MKCRGLLRSVPRSDRVGDSLADVAAASQSAEPAGAGSSATAVAPNVLADIGWQAPSRPADAGGLRHLDPLHFGSVAWNGMVNAALTLGSWERKEAGNDAILKSACAVPATGCFRDISLCSDDLDLVGRANHTGRAVTLAGLADLETGPAHCCHRRGGLGLVQGGKGALEGRRKRARRLRFAAGGVRQDPAARPA